MNTNKIQFNAGDKVKVVSGNCINDYKYFNIEGTVDFQCSPVAGIDGLVYVMIKAPGQRKARSVTAHTDSLVRC